MGLVLSIIGATAGLGAAVARLRSEADNESARLWRENAEAERARGDRLEQALSELQGRVTRLEAENAVLRSLATGAGAVEELRALVARQHAEVLTAVASMRLCGALGTAPGN
ncbi:hypothetical protein [Streptomyces sp. NPDC050507]|uniref:hypothetical protein n=1 Tax=Streptomyces sp. NPDC050507 TaxID=3365619 RepID=UPI0037966766